MRVPGSFVALALTAIWHGATGNQDALSPTPLAAVDADESCVVDDSLVDEPVLASLDDCSMYVDSARNYADEEGASTKCTGLDTNTPVDYGIYVAPLEDLAATVTSEPDDNANELPGGSYLASCRGCRLKIGTAKGEQWGVPTLFCSRCPKLGETQATSPSQTDWFRPGMVAEASLPLSKCGLYKNERGSLACEAPPNGNIVPEGPYQSSCGGCTFSKTTNTLACTHCRQGTVSEASKYWSPKFAGSSLRHTCKQGETVDNVEGQLKCVPDLQEVEAMKALRTILDVDSEDLTLRVDSGDGDPWGEEAEEFFPGLHDEGPVALEGMTNEEIEEIDHLQARERAEQREEIGYLEARERAARGASASSEYQRGESDCVASVAQMLMEMADQVAEEMNGMEKRLKEEMMDQFEDILDEKEEQWEALSNQREKKWQESNIKLRAEAEQRITRATRPLELRLATLEARWEQLSSGRTGAAAATSQPDAKGAVEDPASAPDAPTQLQPEQPSDQAKGPNGAGDAESRAAAASRPDEAHTAEDKGSTSTIGNGREDGLVQGPRTANRNDHATDLADALKDLHHQRREAERDECVVKEDTSGNQDAWQRALADALKDIQPDLAPESSGGGDEQPPTPAPPVAAADSTPSSSAAETRGAGSTKPGHRISIASATILGDAMENLVQLGQAEGADELRHALKNLGVSDTVRALDLEVEKGRSEPAPAPAETWQDRRRQWLERKQRQMEDRKSKKKGKAAGWTRHKAGTDPQAHSRAWSLAVQEVLDRVHNT